MNNISKILWGVILIIIGVIIGSNSLGFTNVNIFFEGWWTLFIIIPCFVGIFNSEDKKGNVIGLLIGIILLLAARDVISFELIGKLMIPFILVMIGLTFIFNEVWSSKIKEKVKQINKSDMEHVVATFSEQKVDKDGETLNNINLEAIFGSVDFDARKANMKKEIIIKASSIFGGIDILVPNDVTVKVKSTAIFGGVDNKCKNKDNTKVIYVDAFCLFGGIEIK